MVRSSGKEIVMTQYFYTVVDVNDLSDEGDARPVVDVQSGSLALVSYAAKEAGDLLDEKGEYNVTFGEVGADRPIVSFTGDAETLNAVISARLRKLRKLAKDATE